LFTTRSRKVLARACTAILITATSLAFTGLGSAEASTKTRSHTPPGDNGTVKIHRSTTSADDPRNEPKVCDFYLVGFHFDAGQQVSWEILSWPPTGNRTKVLSGALTLDQSGHGRTTDLKLPDGHYKLDWTFNGEHGKAKHKVFWVKCSSENSTPTPTPTPSQTPTPTPTPGTTAPSSPSPSPSPSTPAPGAAPVPTPVASDLPVTG
jgi:hypothetical protein